MTIEQRQDLLDSKVQGMNYTVELDGEIVFKCNTTLDLWEFTKKNPNPDFKLYALEPNSYRKEGYRKLEGYLEKKIGRTVFYIK